MLARTQTAPASPAPIYFVEVNLGKLGNVFVETDRDTNSRANVIGNIVSGEWDRPLRVLEITEDENRCRDVSEDIAREICDRMVDDGTCALFFGGLYDFLEDKLGCEHMAKFERELVDA